MHATSQTIPDYMPRFRVAYTKTKKCAKTSRHWLYMLHIIWSTIAPTEKQKHNPPARVCHYVQLLASSWWPVILGLVANFSTSRLISHYRHKGPDESFDAKQLQSPTYDANAGTLLMAAVTVLVAALPVRLACTNRHYGCCQRNDDGEEGETHYGGVLPRWYGQ